MTARLLRHTVTCAACALGSGLGFAPLLAQTVNYAQVVPPAGSLPRTFADYLVQLAWQNNAMTEELGAEIAISDIEIKQARRSWLDQINGNVNFSSRRDTLAFFGQNEFGSNNNQFLFPGYNYGISLNLGGLINTGQRVRVAEQERRIAGARENQERTQLRAVVLARLEAYENAFKILAIRRSAQVDADANRSYVQSLFDQGQAQFEDLGAASDSYNRASENTALAESQVVLARIALEEAVSVPLDQVLGQRSRFSE